jgi:hypothetical protein
MSDNPLKAYFRRPEIYAQLPCGGAFWPEGTIEIPVSGELAVYPMTAADEISLRTPDALMNGHAVVSLLESCIPSIKDAWQTPLCDIDALLIASRIASVGSDLELSTKCPNCDHPNEFIVDLRTRLDLIQPGSWTEPVEIRDLTFHFRPLTFKQSNDLNNRIYAAQRTMQQIEGIEDEDQKEQVNKSILDDVAHINTDTLICSISAIEVDGNTVRDPDYIQEFIDNCDHKLSAAIKKAFDDLQKSSKAEDVHLECEECNYQFNVPFSLDYGSFFV